MKKTIKTKEEPKIESNQCEVCSGKGRVSDKESCNACEGTGVKK